MSFRMMASDDDGKVAVAAPLRRQEEEMMGAKPSVLPTMANAVA